MPDSIVGTDADEQCEFRYQPEGWGKAYRFLALRYQKKDEDPKQKYQLFATQKYIYRVFVTDRKETIDLLVWFYNQRAGAENLIKEANNDAGLAAHPSRQWAANCVHFQLVMLAYNLNCWLLLFHRDEKVQVDKLKHSDGAIAFSVCGGEDLAACGEGGYQLQRSLSGAWIVPAADGSAT